MALDAYALTLAMLALGWLFARLNVLPSNAPEVLNLIVLYLCLPAAVLLYVPQLHWDARLAGLALTPWLLMLAAVGCVLALARWLRLSRAQTAVLLLCVALGNTSYLGFPLVSALLGAEAVGYALVYDQFGTFLLLSTFGLTVIARYSGDAPPGWRVIVRRVVTFPPLWALVVGLTVMPAAPPEWLHAGLSRLSGALLPLVVLAVGLSARFRVSASDARALAAGLGLKLMVMPALALALSWALGLRGVMFQVNVLEAAMAPMITAAALATLAGLAPRLAAAMTVYGVVLALLTLSGWHWLLVRITPL